MNDKLLLQDLVVLLAKKSGITQKDADKFFRELFQLILERIYENDIVKIKDLGTFKLVEINSRESVDVNTGEKIEIPAHFKMAFTPDRSLKEIVNEPFAHFESVILDDVESSDEEQEYSINNFTETIADNFKPVVDSFSNIGDELLLEDDDDDLLETDDLEDEPEDLLREEVSFLPKKNLEKDEPVIDTKSGSKPESGKEFNTPTKELVSKEDALEADETKRRINLVDRAERKILPEINLQKSKTARKAPPLLDLLDTKKDRPESDKIISEATVETVEDAPEEILLSEPVINTATSEGAINQEKQAVSNPDLGDQDDADFNYIDYNKLAKESNKKRNILIYIIIAIIAAFAIYQFAKLFDVTYDYEYYINHVPPLTLSDSMRMVDEQVKPNPLYHAGSDTTSSATDRRVDLSTASVNPFTDERMESNMEELTRQLYTQNSIERKEIIISDRLQIKITNKAQIYLNEK